MELATHQGVSNRNGYVNCPRSLKSDGDGICQGIINWMEMATDQGMLNLYGGDMWPQMKQCGIIFE